MQLGNVICAFALIARWIQAAQWARRNRENSKAMHRAAGKKAIRRLGLAGGEAVALRTFDVAKVGSAPAVGPWTTALSLAVWRFLMASRKGVEPLTPGLGNLCSILLSYRDTIHAARSRYKWPWRDA